MTDKFRRLSIIELLRRPIASKDMPLVVAISLMEAAKSDAATLLDELKSHPDGLTEAQADGSREFVGLNEVAHEKPRRWWVHLWQCYRNPFNLLLTVLATISYYTEDMKAT